jgi:hypothetical protein
MAGVARVAAPEMLEERVRRLRLHERTMRPLGGGGFVKKLEGLLGRCPARGPRGLRPGRLGRPPEKAR